MIKKRTIAVVLYPRKAKNNLYPVKIRFCEDRKSKYIPLPIHIEKRYWLKSVNRISSSHPKHEEYNYIIDKKIKEYEEVYKVSNKFLNSSLNVFVDLDHKIKVELKNKYGNRKKHKTLYYHLERFWGNQELNYFDIDKEFFLDFKNYLTENIKSRDTLSNTPSENTIFGYLKVLSTFLNEQKREGKYLGDLSIIRKILPRKVPTPKRTLDLNDIWALDNTQIFNPLLRPLLFDSLNTFMFNFWSQGLRIGDCLRLKWGNIEDDLIVIRMGKTGRLLTIPLTDKNCFRLFWYLEDFPSLYDWDKKLFNFKYREYFSIDDFSEITQHNSDLWDECSKNFPDLDEWVYDNYIEYFTCLKHWEELSKQYDIPFFHKDSNFHMRSNEYSKEYYDFVRIQNDDLTYLDGEIKRLRKLFFDSIVNHVKNYSRKPENKNKYIFPFLRGMENETDINKLANKISSSTVLINRSLQEIGHKLDINKRITNHLSRHSITSISKGLGVDIYDLKNMLGHTSVKQTEIYVNSLSTLTSIENTKKISNILDN
jgi:integrase